MENTTSQPTELEALFLDAGLPATEVAACPAPDCTICRTPIPKAA